MIARINAFPLLLLLALALPAGAGDDLDVTMRMVDEQEDITDSVTREIRLPDLPGLRQGESRSRAQDAPARQLREQVRERGRAFGQSVSGQARESRPGRPQAPAQGRPPELPNSDRPEHPPQSAKP
ncbi:MAG: hypothetical protein SVX28_00080 [Pseudomonadota bacterium]|nr:hypothetical protein [Pseudomonadota bacterium]